MRTYHRLTCRNENCPLPNRVFYHIRKTRRFCSKKCSSPANANKKRDKTLKTRREYIVWSCGGGVDSVAMAVLIWQGKLPKPDYAIMTDNGYDASYTWDYINQVLKPKLSEVGVELQIIKSSDYVNTDIVVNGWVVLPAYSWHEGKAGRFSTKCSGPWKSTSTKRWLKEQGVKRCVNWLGIAADEKQRAKESNLQWFKYEYPLIPLNLARRDCKRLIAKAGWPAAMRSSCVMCPQKTDNQWLDLRDDYPDDFQRAIDIEKEMHKTHPNVFIHRSLKQLRDADFKGGG